MSKRADRASRVPLTHRYRRNKLFEMVDEEHVISEADGKYAVASMASFEMSRCFDSGSILYDLFTGKSIRCAVSIFVE